MHKTIVVKTLVNTKSVKADTQELANTKANAEEKGHVCMNTKSLLKIRK